VDEAFAPAFNIVNAKNVLKTIQTVTWLYNLYWDQFLHLGVAQQKHGSTIEVLADASKIPILESVMISNQGYFDGVRILTQMRAFSIRKPRDWKNDG